MALSKEPLPLEIREEMKMYRLGLAGLPISYTNFHKELAQRHLSELQKKGLIVHNQYEQSDGWGEMKIIGAVAEYKRKLFKIHWHDGNQEFFYEHASSGGSSPLDLTFKELEII